MLAGHWTKVAGGRVWTLPIVSRGAKSLSVMFDKFDIPEGAEMYVYNGEKTLGAFTHKNVKPHGKFSVQPLDGDSLTIELFVPTGAPAPSLSIFKVGHGYKLLGYNDSGRCTCLTRPKSEKGEKGENEGGGGGEGEGAEAGTPKSPRSKVL